MSLKSNGIGIEAGCVLAEMLASNQTLTRLPPKLFWLDVIEAITIVTVDCVTIVAVVVQSQRGKASCRGHEHSRCQGCFIMFGFSFISTLHQSIMRVMYVFIYCLFALCIFCAQLSFAHTERVAQRSVPRARPLRKTSQTYSTRIVVQK